MRTYDAENHMLTATNSATNTYTYDAGGRRVRRNIAGVETWAVYGMDGELVAEYGANVAVFVPHEEYGYRGGQLLITAANGDEGRLQRFINHYYTRVLNRNPTTTELSNQMNTLVAAGGSQSQLDAAAKTLARGLFNSSEYAARNRSDHDFVYDLYYACLQRQPDQGGWDYWTSEVPAQGRANIVEALINNGEFTGYSQTLYGLSTFDQERTNNFVIGLYVSVLNRWPSSANNWAELVAQQNAIDTNAAQGRAPVISAATTMASNLFQLSEYANRNRSDHDYVSDLYWAYWQSGPDASGWSYWEGQVGSQGRTAVRDSFAASAAFQETAGALYREVLWLTADQLGTPRMIAERTGALAGMKRHDYLPFGEELVAGQGGRTTTQGYTGDSVRQHFTGYEADAESGLNFAQARYQSPMQGRFTSVDPLGKSATTVNPQSFNRYSYCLNNPTNLTDPTGMMTGASESWSDVSGTFWGEAFDFNASHFGGPEIVQNGMEMFPDRRKQEESNADDSSAVVEDWLGHSHIRTGTASAELESFDPQNSTADYEPFVLSNPDKLESGASTGSVQYLNEAGIAMCARLPMMWSNDQEHYRRAKLITVENWIMGDAVTPNMSLKAGTVLATFDRKTGIFGNGEPHSGSHTVVFLRWETRNGVVGMVVAQQMAGLRGRAELGWTTFDSRRPYYANAGAFSVVMIRAAVQRPRRFTMADKE